LIEEFSWNLLGFSGLQRKRVAFFSRKIKEYFQFLSDFEEFSLPSYFPEHF